MTVNGELLACSGRYDPVRDSGPDSRPPLTMPIDAEIWQMVRLGS